METNVSSDSGPIFSKIWFLESIPIGQRQTGEHIYHDGVEPHLRARGDFESELIKAPTRDEFLSSLERIRGEAVKGKYPMLHIDCHGDQNGLQLANNDVVDWDTLKDYLVSINEASQVNLVVFLAACEGVWLIRTVEKIDRAPFWGIIAPSEPISTGDIEADCTKFYQVFLKELSADNAMSSINERHEKRIYHFLSAEGIFLKAYSEYYKSFCRRRAKQERLERLTTEALTSSGIGSSVTSVRKNLKRELRNEEGYFIEKRKRFFFIDKYSENDGRFGTDFNRVKEFSKRCS